MERDRYEYDTLYIDADTEKEAEDIAQRRLNLGNIEWELGEAGDERVSHIEIDEEHEIEPYYITKLKESM